MRNVAVSADVVNPMPYEPLFVCMTFKSPQMENHWVNGVLFLVGFATLYTWQ